MVLWLYGSAKQNSGSAKQNTEKYYPEFIGLYSPTLFGILFYLITQNEFWQLFFTFSLQDEGWERQGEKLKFLNLLARAVFYKVSDHR